MLPALAVLDALALFGILAPAWRRLVRSYQRVLAVLAVGLALVGASALPPRFGDLFGGIFGKLSRGDYYCSKRFNSTAFSLAENLAAGDYVNARTEPGDRIFIFADEPLAGFLSQRRVSTRFYSSRFLLPDGSHSAFSRELLQSLSSSPPEVFLTRHGRGGDERTSERLPDSYQALLAWPELRDFVAGNYELEAQVGRFDVLRRGWPEDSLPRTAAGNPAIAADLVEAAQFVVHQSGSGDYRSVLWPGGAMSWPSVLAPKVVGYRRINHDIWLGARVFSDYLPALSVWIRADDRPFASLAPFSFQSDGENFVSDEFRFGLLHVSKNGLVFVYEVDQRTGSEVVTGEDE